MSLAHERARLGGEDVLEDHDLSRLNIATTRVYEFMRDHQWHTAQQIRVVAQGSEGLRRMRQLRAHGLVIEKRRVLGRATWEYRLRGPKE